MCVDDGNDDDPFNRTYRFPSLLTANPMCFVGDVKWVIKDHGRSFEVDMMLLAIALIFGLIPFKAHLLCVHYCTDKMLAELFSFVAVRRAWPLFEKLIHFDSFSAAVPASARLERELAYVTRHGNVQPGRL